MEFCVDTLLLALNWPALFVNVYWSLLHHTHLFCMHWVEASAWPQSSLCGHQLCTHILCVSETPLVRSSRNFPLVFLSPLESILLPQHPLMRSFSGLPILPFFLKKISGPRFRIISSLKMLPWKEQGTVTSIHLLHVTHDFIIISCTLSLTGHFSIMKSCSLIDLSHSHNNSFYIFEDDHWLSQLVLLNSVKLHHSSYTINPFLSLVFSSKISPFLSKCASKQWHCPAE